MSETKEPKWCRSHDPGVDWCSCGYTPSGDRARLEAENAELRRVVEMFRTAMESGSSAMLMVADANAREVLDAKR